MAEFDEKLNELLSNPDSMAQIMRLAQSLSGETGGGGDPEPPQSPPQTRQASQDRHHQGPPPENGGGDLLSGLTGGLDSASKNAVLNAPLPIRSAAGRCFGVAPVSVIRVVCLPDAQKPQPRARSRWLVVSASRLRCVFSPRRKW